MAQKKSEIEIKQSKKNKLETSISNPDDERNIPNLRKELREVATEILNLTTIEESFTTNLEMIISSLDAKNNERLEIAKQYSDLIQNENDIIKYKYTLEDMIFIINEYQYKNNESSNVEKTNGSVTQKSSLSKKDKGNNLIAEQQKLFKRFNGYTMRIDDYSFYNLNNSYLAKGVNLSVGMLLFDSNRKLNEQKEKIISEKEFLSAYEKASIETILKMADNKLSMLFEQNALIAHINTMFKNMKKETNQYYNSKENPKEDSEKKKFKFEEDKDFQALSQLQKNKYIFNSNTKDIILNFLQEGVYSEDPFLKNHPVDKTLKIEFRFAKNNPHWQIIIDTLEELEKENEIFEQKDKKPKNKEDSKNSENSNDFTFNLDNLAMFKRKEKISNKKN